MAEVIGREPELAAIARLLTAARSTTACLVLEGEAGIGKTTLWRAAVERAREEGYLVLRSRPSEAEAQVALSAVEELVDGVPEDAWTALPPPQRRALEIALLRAEPDERLVDHRAVASAVRTLVASAGQATLIAIDDIQWLDAPSVAILDSVLRRLDLAFGVLATRRLSDSSALRLDELLETGAVERLSLDGLSVGALQRLVRGRIGHPLSRSALVRVHGASQGNPLFALEIVRALERQGVPRVDEPLPVPDDVRELVRARVQTLPDSTRSLLVAAAAAPRPQADQLLRAFGRDVEDDLARAEREGFVVRRSVAVAFAHPLYADAILATATTSELRTAHRRLAELAETSEARARHRALGSIPPDEEAAVGAHRAAHEALLRAAPAAAAELVELALAIGGEDSAARTERVLDRAYFLYCANEPRRALESLEDVDDWSGWPPSLEARARGLVVELVLLLDGASASVERGERMLREDIPIEARARVLAHLSNAYSHDLRRAARCDEEAALLLDELGPRADPGTVARALCYRVRNRLGLGFGIDRSDVERALAHESMLPRERWLAERVSYRFGIWFRHVDELDESRSWLERDLATAVETADEFLQVALLVHLGLTDLWAGRLFPARTRMDAATALAEELGSRPADLLGARALVLAHLGEADEVRALAAGVLAEEEVPTGQPGPLYAHAGLGLLELSLADDRAADASLRNALRGVDAAGLREPGIFRVHANAAEAALGVGDRARASTIGESLVAHGERTGHRWALATGWRCRALVAAAGGELEQARDAAERALVLHDDLSLPFERARTALVAGIVERRARRRTRAQALLSESAEAFEHMGARLWAARARDELARVGIRRAREDGLTPGEWRFAELAASGLRNREIAAALFVSPKTVEANLARVYRKLGVRSRAELAARWSSLQT
jgi:DNA-binding CsgD family transcriptional regulator